MFGILKLTTQGQQIILKHLLKVLNSVTPINKY